MIKKLVLTTLFLLFIAASAAPGEPQAVLRERVDEVVMLLKSPRYAEADGRTALDRRLKTIIGEMFDYAKVARLALGSNWRLFSPDQKKVFANTFADLLGTVYVNRIKGDFSDLSVRYTDSEMLSETKAMVRSVILRGGVKTPVTYYLLESGSGWRVYNVKIEGVSMVSNYRSQFNKILLNDSPDQLIDRLEKKLVKMRDGS